MLIVWNFVYKNHWSNLSFSHSSRGYCCYVTLIIKTKKKKNLWLLIVWSYWGQMILYYCPQYYANCAIISCRSHHLWTATAGTHIHACPHTHPPTHPPTQGVCMWACLQTLSLLIAGFVFYSKCWWGSVVCTKYEVRWDEQALTKSPLFPQQCVLSCNAIKD